MRFPITLLVVFTIVSIWSFIGCKELFTWFLECLPAFLGVIILVLTYKTFKFSNLTYLAIFIQCVVLVVGGHYTYAEVPLFDWIKNTFHQTRNNYDKLGHFMQGFTPSIIVREIFLKKKVVNGKKWLSFIVISIALAISAFYELIEWFVSVNTGSSGDAFLGTQGYIWDTQSDMLTALIGSAVAIFLFKNIQNTSIKNTN
ncbi:putative membrane protein [Pedobacter sp. UYP30]|uniref:DUF2238 domain-containing protein n=1 Tax=Pedobacter sp. UYP30 TaxID=1756400 RepID=UPI0033971B43